MIAPASDKFRDTATDYFKDLNEGKADAKDFEKHMYGQFGAKSYYTDDSDRQNDKDALRRKQLQR